MAAEIPRSLRQLFRRLPVGHSSIYLNELQPRNQILFLLSCMGAETTQSSTDGGRVRRLRLVESNLSVKFAPRGERSAKSNSENKKFMIPLQSEWIPSMNDMESTLSLPDGSSGQLEAYSAPHPSWLSKPTLFLLAVPQHVLEGPRSLEAVLQERLIMANAKLHWCARNGSDDDTVLGGLWGCTMTEAREAAAVAGRNGYRLFFLGRGRQRLLSGDGPMLRELGSWCPGVFRSFQIDVRDNTTVDETTQLSSATTVSLLEAARSGFAQMDRSAATSRSQDEHAAVQPVLTLAVAEVFVDARRHSAVQWSRVQDDPLISELFDALHDPRHYCVTDALLYASEHIVLPFLIRGGDIVKQGERARFMRWTDLRSRLRWRFFESAFGSLSQLLRPEDVTVAGRGLDPFILPLHDKFITRVLLPSLRAHHKEGICPREENGIATVNILDGFNSLTSGSRGNTSVSAVNFATEDLPGLVKYLLYFGDYFEVSKDGKNVSFPVS